MRARWLPLIALAACEPTLELSMIADPLTADSTADDTTSDTTADRDRNVQVGGWGAAGTGYAQTLHVTFPSGRFTVPPAISTLWPASSFSGKLLRGPPIFRISLSMPTGIAPEVPVMCSFSMVAPMSITCRSCAS